MCADPFVTKHNDRTHSRPSRRGNVTRHQRNDSRKSWDRSEARTAASLHFIGAHQREDCGQSRALIGEKRDPRMGIEPNSTVLAILLSLALLRPPLFSP